MVNEYVSNPKDFGLNSREVDKRKKQYELIQSDKNSLKRTYDSFFQKKANKDINATVG
jgi:hypothetical protein